MPGQNGQSPNDSDSESDSPATVPSLTVGQRLLLKLPDLGRNKSARSASVRTEPEATEPAKKAPSKPGPAKARSNSDAGTRPLSSAALPSGDRDGTDDVENFEDAEDVEVVDEDETQTPVRSKSAPSRSSSSRSSSPRSSSSTRSSSSAAARPRTPSPYDDMPTSQLTVLMRKLDDKERLLAFGAAPLGVVLAIVVTIVAVHANPALHHKGHESPGVIVADGGVGVAFALFVFAMAWFRRRSLTAFALLFLGYSVGLVGPGIPFLFLGGYFLFKAWKIQKVLTSRGVNTRPQRQKRPSERPSRDPKSRRDSQINTTSARPTASKRYTPPKPPPKRPPVPKPEKAAGS